LSPSSSLTSRTSPRRGQRFQRAQETTVTQEYVPKWG
jgi:hypothetical protein